MMEIKMRKLAIVAASALAITMLPASAFAASSMTDLSSQGVGIEVGPGGMRVGDTHGRYRSERRSERRGPDCRSLRLACMNKDRLGEQGEGNCRRYRQACR
jgi:hypothetical protein